MGEIDAIGDLVTGGMLGRAVEPETGQVGADGHMHEVNCLNCGTLLAGDYCHQCGQRAHVHRSLRGFLQDMVQGAFNFEGKIWRTLPMLAWCPGDLTRRYVAGERARFVSPVALYLFSVFLMFAVLNLTGALGSGEPAHLKKDLATAVVAQQATVAKLEQARAAAATTGKGVAELDRKLAQERAGLAQLTKLRAGELPVRAGNENDVPQWARGLVEKAQRNPDLMVTNVQDAASKFSWLLIPLSVPFLWLLFPFSRRFHLYDHMVFVTYSLSFMMILVIVGGLLVAAGASAAAGFLFFVPPFHMYRQLKGAYQLGRFGAVWRTIALVTFAFLAGVLFFVLMVAIGIL